MSLELRLDNNGKMRPFFYGRFKINGKRYCHNLAVAIEGEPPPSRNLRDQGDPAFEASRRIAQAKLDSLIEQARSKRDAARVLQKIWEINTGEQLRMARLDKLHEEWAKIPRKRKPDDRYASQCVSTLRRFAAFIQRHNTGAVDLSHVTRSAARAFMDAETNRGVTAKTWNDTLLLLRGTLKRLLPEGSINPLSGIPTRETETVFRKPFTPEELKAILDAARQDEFLRPIVITGICTAMRRGDCCLLEWKDVDLARNFITVKTAKTGQTVAIPIFPLLQEELKKRTVKRTGYVFPDQAAKYTKDPVSISKRLRELFATAGFRDLGEDEEALEENEGNSTNGYRGEIHFARKEGEGLRRASIRDFHSFRVTWVTIALTGGVPLELVQKVTGHKTTDIVLNTISSPAEKTSARPCMTPCPNCSPTDRRPPATRCSTSSAK